jgi:hypothetical protein
MEAAAAQLDVRQAGIQTARAMRSTVLTVVGCVLFASCGDPAGPLDASSAAFDVTADFSKATLSLSDSTDSIVVRITVRNPLPVTATVIDQRVWRRAVEWDCDFDATTPNSIAGLNFSRLSIESLTLGPERDTTHTLVVHRQVFRDFLPGHFNAYAGVQGRRAARVDFWLTP